MFLLVSVRHVGAHPGEHQHGVSIQTSISLGKTFLPISRIRNIPLTWILARAFVYVPSFISQTLDFIYWTVWFLLRSILNGVTLKTSNKSPAVFIFIREIDDLQRENRSTIPKEKIEGLWTGYEGAYYYFSEHCLRFLSDEGAAFTLLFLFGNGHGPLSSLLATRRSFLSER